MSSYDSLYDDVKNSLEKSAIFIHLRDGDDGKLNYVLATRNKTIIDFFDSSFTHVPYGENRGNMTIDAYELRTGKVIIIDITAVVEVHFLGLPHELPPPLFINPVYQDYINSDAITSVQIRDFLTQVKEEREAGFYRDHTVTFKNLIELIKTKNILTTLYKILPDTDKLFCLFDDVYGLYNIISNTEYWEQMQSLQKKVMFIPIILRCLKMTQDEFISVLPGFISGNIFSKTLWIEFLNEKRDTQIIEYEKQACEIVETYNDLSIDTTEKSSSIANTEQQSIIEQYQRAIDNLKSINFENELAAFDDYRLYLRYWPNEFVEAEDFHALVRPFTELEIKVLSRFIAAGISFNYDELIHSDYDYFNSVIDTLQQHTDTWREYKLNLIKHIAPKRAEVLRAEMKDVLATLTPEEQAQLNSAMDEVLKIENYERELSSLNRLTDIMSYWPAALSPAPAEAYIL